MIIAFSGGVDSSLVAYVAGEVLGESALAVTSGSQSLKRRDLTLTRSLALSWNLNHRVIISSEIDSSSYCANLQNRCFHCKTSLYSALREIAQAEGYNHILNGTNVDDLGDYRPGLLAAEQLQVKSPLVEVGFDKQDIRDLAAELSLPNAAKPQEACLASRVPYGTPITTDLLQQLERAETALSKLGFGQFRVRHHGDIARLEIMPEDFAKAIELKDIIQASVQECGYHFVVLDLAGFRSGSLNEQLP